MTCPSKSLDVNTINYIIRMLQQEWYDLNDMVLPADETPRDIGLRVGKKCQLNKTINDLTNQKKFL